MLRRLFLTLLGVAALTSIMLNIHAQEYSLSEWKQGDGLPTGRIYAITQTPDGFLWLGTGDGLVRYDGAQFLQRSFENDGIRPLGQVLALNVGSTGMLLAGTASGMVVKVVEGHATAVSVGSPVLGISPVRNGCFAVRTGVGTKALREQTMTPMRAECGFENAWPSCTNNRNRGAPYENICLQSRLGTTWIGTSGRGLYAIRHGREIGHYTRLSGLTNDHISALYEDREANIWVGTQNGLNRLRQGKFLNVASPVFSALPKVVAAGAADTLWIGSTKLLQQRRLSTGEVRTLMRGPVSALAVAQNGSVAVISRNRLYLLLKGSGQPRLIGQVRGAERIAWAIGDVLWVQDSAGLQRVHAGQVEIGSAVSIGGSGAVLAMAAQGSLVWLATADGMLLRVEDGVVRALSLPVLSPEFRVSCLTPDQAGGVWLATNAGLLLYNNGTFLKWNRASGLPGERLQWVVADGRGALWIGYSMGIARVAIADLRAAAKGGFAVRADLFNAGDGLDGSPEVRGQDAVAVDHNGAIWFTVSDGLSRIDPAHLSANALPPPTRILQTVVDGQTLPASEHLPVPPHSRTLQISYAGLSLADPAKNRYRYRLVGFDDTWQEAGDRRTAFYNDLNPGSYTFQVVSSNNDGLWGDHPASLSVFVEPGLYQRLWFRLASLAVVFALAAFSYQRRMHSQRSVLQQMFAIRIAERNRLAGDLHDHLIQEMMGVGLQLEMADAATPASADAKASLQRALALTRIAIGDGRGTLLELRGEPATWSSLERRLQRVAELENVRGGSLSFARAGRERPLQSDTARELFMIAQELLRNALRHAPGSDVHYAVSFEKQVLRVVMSDTGSGIGGDDAEQRPGHFGIRGMRERAQRIDATLRRDANESGGTKWYLDIPGTRAYALTIEEISTNDTT